MDGSNLETSPIKIRLPSQAVVEKAWDRAKPVLKTAAGGALLTGAAYLSKGVINNFGSDFLGNPLVSQATLLGALGVNAGILGASGASLMKEPVNKAFQYFKSKLPARK